MTRMQPKNYSTDEGNKLIIGGALVIEAGATVTGLNAGGGINLAQYSVSVSNGAGQTVPPNTPTKLTNLSRVDWDPSGFWSVAQQRFQPTIEGLFNIDAKATIESLEDGKRMVTFVYKNDALYALLGRGTARVLDGETNAAGFDGSLLVHMNGTTDYLDLRVYHANSGSGFIYGNPVDEPRYTTFSAAYLGPTPEA